MSVKKIADNQTIITPWGPLGYITYKRTYARHLNEDISAPTEEYADTIDRIMKACDNQLNVGFTDDEKKSVRQYFMSLKCSTAGRFLWQLGTNTVEKLGLLSLQNCFAAETEFATSKGIRKFSDFQDGDEVVVRGKLSWKEATVKSFGEQNITELKLRKKKSSTTIRTTAGHRWIKSDGSIVTTNELRPGDLLKNFTPKTNFHSLTMCPIGIQHGLTYGDGNWNENAKSCAFTPCGDASDESLAETFDWKVESVIATDTKEKVWCIVEPEHEEFTLACGVLTKNCAFTTVDEPVRPFTWAFDALMLGSGVGYNIQREFVYEIPKVKVGVTVTRKDTNDADFIVPDSREGWVELLQKTLEAFFLTGKSFSYSVVCIRSKGSPIKTFGGTASGPEDLCRGIGDICGVLHSRAGKKVRPIDCLDIMNIIGYIVVSGNVRRCLPKDAQVHTRGGLTNIQDVVPGTEVLTTKGYKKVTNTFVQGAQQTVIIKTQDGEFECTPNHKMAVLTSLNTYKWVEAGNLKSGDRLVSTNESLEGDETSMPSWSYQNPPHSTTCKDIVIPPLDSDMAWFLGLFHADGYTYANRQKDGFNAYVNIVVGLNEGDIAEKAAAQLRRFGLDNVKVGKRKNENSIMVHVQSKQLAWYLDEHFKKPNTAIRIPECIIKSKKEIRLAYAAGVADGDGALGNRPAIVVSTVYQEFAKDLQNLFYSCGIQTRLRCDEHQPSRQGWQKICHVALITHRSRNDFGNINELFKEIPARSGSFHANGFPENYIHDTKVRRKFGLGKGKTQSLQMNLDSFESLYGKSELVPIEVLEINKGRVVETFDIEVDEVHEFFCNGYLTHNSAQIAIGDFDDRDFLKAKRWDLGSIPNWRAMSNNSVVCNDFSKLPEEFWDGYIGKGEPYGLINLRLSRKIGRLGDDRFPDKDVQGYNPSLRRGTKVWTSDGIKEIQDLQDSAFTVKNLRGESADAKCWLSGNDQELYEITLENGFKYYSTAEHKWPIYTEHGYVRCETTELKPGHMLPITQRDSLEYGCRGSYEDGFAIGWLYGDGWVTKRKDDGRTQYGWICSLADMETGIDKKLAAFLQRVTGHEHTGCARAHGVEFNSANKLLDTFMLGFGVSHKSNGLPSSIWSDGSEDFRKGFIDALFSADGTVDSNYKSARILLSQSNQKLITDTAELLGFYGIKNSMDTFVVTNAKFPNGKDYQKNYTRHTLRISTRQGIEHFRKIFTLSHTEKQRKLEAVSKAGTKPLWGSHYYIKSVTKTTLKEDVWDVAVFDDTHCFQLSQCITGNCGEQSLNDKETCALGEVFLPNITSKAELQDVVNQLYRIIKHSLILPCHLKETEKVVHKNMRMGIGVTGYLQATAEQKSWLPDVYEALREFDKVYSSQHGWNESIKLTTCKPSGTLSLLAGVTSGIHPGYSRHYIRRIRISSSSPLVDLCRRHGYSVEYQKNFDMSEDHNTVVVSFPCKHTDETVIASDVSAIDQMEWVKKLQTDWSDNSVSCTVYYKKEELPGIKEWLANNFNHSVKTISFLLHSEHGFIQAPLEEITAEEFVRLSKGTKPITQGGELNGDEGIDLSECIGGVCPIR